MNVINKEYSVSEISSLIKEVFDSEYFSNINVIGEIYSIKITPKITYIDLGDTDSTQDKGPVLKCAFFSYYNLSLDELKKGDVVKIKGKLAYYQHGSSITLWGNNIESLLSQLGKNLIKKRKLLEKLDKLGYLNIERKKTIPEFVSKVAIVTALNSAAYSDIITTLKNQFPVSTILFPCLVQGDLAASSMTKALKKAIESDCEIIIFGRGGGSNTDLSSFDSEEVALTIATSTKPIITCIGHSIDESIADKVADRVAITPTEAGKLINPSKQSILNDISLYKLELNKYLATLINNYKLKIDNYKTILFSSSIFSKIKISKSNISKYKGILLTSINKIMYNFNTSLTDYINSLNNNYLNIIHKNEKKLNDYKVKLNHYDQNSIIKSGYIKLFKEKKVITSIKDLKENDEVTLSLKDGKKEAIIK